MEKMDFSTLIFTVGFLSFLTIIVVVRLFSFNIDNTNLVILLFFMVCAAAFSKIEKQEVETKEVK